MEETQRANARLERLVAGLEDSVARLAGNGSPKYLTVFSFHLLMFFKFLEVKREVMQFEERIQLIHLLQILM